MSGSMVAAALYVLFLLAIMGLTVPLLIDGLSAEQEGKRPSSPHKTPAHKKRARRARR